MIYELNHFGIMVSDIDASLEFYDKLDARVVFKHSTEKGVELRYLQIAGGMIELVAVPASLAPAGFKHGIDHLAFMSDDLDNDYQRLIDAGCTADGGTKDAASGKGRLGFLQRPDGARIELLQRDDEFRTPEVPGIITAFDHYAYQVEDIDEAKEFFGTAVGLPKLHEMATADGNVVRAFFNLNYDVLGLRAGASAPGKQFPHFVLRVKNVDEAVATLAERGLTPVEPVIDSPSGNGRSVFFEAPDGVRIELLDRPDLREL